MDSVTWKIGGEAGFGIMSSGTMFARTFSRAGYHVLATNEYPSRIRGGHNLITVRVATRKFEALNRDLHLLVALNRETIELHKQELNKDALVIFDPKDGEYSGGIPIPLSDIVTKLGGDPVMRNMVAIGASVALLGGPFENLEKVIADQFKKKSADVVTHNVEIARAGYDFIKDEKRLFLAPPEKKEEQLVINASEAIGVGAVRAGLKFAAIYPMTPINALITFLADHAKSLNIVYKQPEDEIAGINMALGASLAGARSMVATSGGGFALMVEGLSWAGMIEAPLVIDLGMRVGPSTGMPTWTEQGELQFAIHAGHGEFPRIILAPADAADAYALTVEAFNLADRYQVPVFLLTDKYINESQWCVPKSVMSGEVFIDRGKISAEGKPRYDLSVDDGISPRSFIGQKGSTYIANSYEHDETGHMTENSGMRIAMAAKRMKKLAAMKKDIRAPSVYGDTDADVTFVTWGSTRGPVLEAMKMLRKKSRLIHFSWLYPFPAEETAQLLSGATRIINVEQNGTGQLASLIREHTGILIKEQLLKNDGRTWYPEEIAEKVGNV